MRKQVILTILILILLPTILAENSIDSEIQKLTHYAEEYETGNINYVQLLIYISSAREEMNEILGVTNREMGGVVKQDAIEKILGEPFDETKWVWVEDEEHEKKLDIPVPFWKKIVFDGKKIQIRMEAYPSIFSKRKFKDDEERKLKIQIEEDSIIYRLHFNTEFKRPQGQLDIDAKINNIKSLAEDFNTNPTSSNAENLAKQSVNAERVFQNYFMQGQGKCEDIMKKIFGSENQRQTQKILSNEFTFYEGKNFEAKMRLEMCEKCEWNYINLNMWIEGRGRFKHPKEEMTQRKQRDFKQMTESEIMSEIRQTIESMKNDLESGEYGRALESSRTLNSLNNAWAEKSNNVWEKVKKTFETKINAMSEKQRYEFDQNYGWIKQDQQQRQAVKEIQKEKYEQRKTFYLNLFSGYEMKEFYFTQTDFEKRLIEEFKERGEEICNNNKDDNENEQTDCKDSQCGGKICGAGTQTITSENTTSEIQVDFYCIQSICQAREEINESEKIICGNHICEQGEANTATGNGTCQSDCTFAECPTHEAIECSGKVIFKGEDENECSLPPICIEETETCDTTEDCIQPTCGTAECVKIESEDEKGTCKVTELTLCQAECESWEQEVKVCNNQKIITKICENGQWQKTGAECELLGCTKCGNGCVSEKDIVTMDCEQPTKDFNCFMQNDGKCIKEFLQEPTPTPTDPIVGHECTVANDCGGENDVCSNGKCTPIPKVIKPEPTPELEPTLTPEPEPTPEPTPESEPTPEPEPIPDKTGIVGLFKALLGKLAITGRAIAEETNSPTESSDDNSDSNDNSESDDSGEDSDSNSEPPNQDDNSNNNPEQDNQEDESNNNPEDTEPNDYESYDDESNNNFKDDSDDWERKDKEERERHEEEQKERCAKDCARPCIDKCTRESCGENMDCEIEDVIKSCEKDCSASDDCIQKCTSGEENWWQEFEDEDAHKQEKGVFQVGGGCRQERGRTEGHIWFGGWGDPFEQVQPLKEKYYSGGEADWCKHDLDNLIKQRQEFEKGFDQEFAQWFFEKYLPSSAEDWEQAQSGIYELYWNSVDIQRQFAERMKCLDKTDVQNVMSVNLINIEYETEFGKMEYWEEIKEVKMDWMDEKVTIISPYMKVWIFPSEEFIKYEMKQSMANGEFPGSPEDKAERENQEGLTDKEKQNMRQDNKFMKLIKNIAEQYNGNANGVLQIVDGEEVVFNLYIQVNEQDLMEIKPMLPEEVPAQDITVKIDFAKLYDLIHFEEKEMRGISLESPPWDQKPRHGKIKGFTNGIKMYLKIRSIISSAEVTPESAERDVKKLMKSMLKGMDDKDNEKREEIEKEKGKESEDENSQENQVITGKSIAPPFEF